MRDELNDSRDKGPTWYLAELVIKIAVEGDDRSVVHKNLILIRADGAPEAYEAAVRMGNEHAMSYANPQHKQVHIQFIGLSRLIVLYDRLEHGAELLYEEYIGMSDDEIRALVVPKHRLSVFSEPKAPPSGPDYSSEEILEEVSRIIHDRR